MSNIIVSKENIIDNYIKQINFKEKFDARQIEQDLAILLHERPAVKLEWSAITKINEISGQNTRVEELTGIKIYYTVFDNEGKIAPRKLEYHI